VRLASTPALGLMVIRQIGSVVPCNTNTIRLLELTMKVYSSGTLSALAVVLS